MKNMRAGDTAFKWSCLLLNLAVLPLASHSPLRAWSLVPIAAALVAGGEEEGLSCQGDALTPLGGYVFVSV
jgi:hypothetical protein